MADTNIYNMKARKYNIYAFSKLEFSNFLYEICREVEGSTVPVERSFVMDIEDHSMALKIKKTSRGIKIKFFDANQTSIFKKIELSSAIQAKNIKPEDFFVFIICLNYVLNGIICRTENALRFFIYEFTKSDDKA